MSVFRKCERTVTFAILWMALFAGTACAQGILLERGHSINTYMSYTFSTPPPSPAPILMRFESTGAPDLGFEPGIINLQNSSPQTIVVSGVHLSPAKGGTTGKAIWVDTGQLCTSLVFTVFDVEITGAPTAYANSQGNVVLWNGDVSVNLLPNDPNLSGMLNVYLDGVLHFSGIKAGGLHQVPVSVSALSKVSAYWHVGSAVASDLALTDPSVYTLLKVDLDVQGVADATEDTAGGQIMWNTDMDEGNTDSAGKKILDYEPDNAVGHRITTTDDEVLTASITVQPDGISGKWRITFPSKVRVYLVGSGPSFTEITSGYESSAMTVPSGGVVANLRVEAVDRSTAPKDIDIEASFIPSGTTTPLCPDKVVLTSIIGDLDVTEIRPVQVIENVPLVKDKATLGRIFVAWSSPISTLSDGAYLQGVKAKLTDIPGVDLVSPSMTAYKFSGRTYWRETPIAVDLTINVVNLIRYLGGEAINVKMFFPNAAGTVSYRAIADPDNDLIESDETNNEHTQTGIKVKPFAYSQYRFIWKYARRADDPPFTTSNMGTLAFPHYTHLISTYPIPLSAGFVTFDSSVEPFNAGELLFSMLTALSLTTTMNGYNKGIYVFPDNSLGSMEGVAIPATAPNAVLIEESDDKALSSHEIGHTFGFCDEYEYGGWTGWLPINGECGLDWDEASYPYGYVAADGWDVQLAGGLPANGARISINESDPTTLTYNHFSFMSTSGKWITRENYLTLMDALITGGRDPLLLLVGGMIYDDGTVVLHPLFSAMGYESDVLPGDCSIQLLDTEGSKLRELRFGGPMYDVGDGRKCLPFALAIEFPERTHRMLITRGGTTLLQVVRSPNAPTVAVHKPLKASGENRFSLTLDVADADGDACNIDLSYSANGGMTWSTVAKKQATGRLPFALDTSSLPGSDTGMVRVLVSDGLNHTKLELALVVPDRPPRIDIIARREAASDDKQEKRECEVLVYDLEDGILSTERITWTGRDGRVLGKGQKCVVPASGEQVTVVAEDSKGNRAQKAILLSK